MKVLKEWVIDVPWGNIALISWGDPNGEPVMLVHGRQDSAATFIPLLEHLPEKYHYVGVDLPGHGRSSPFPHGVKVMRFHFVGALEVVINYLKWTSFTYIGHSMGCEQALFYNAVYPGRIKKLIHLDMGPSLQRLQMHDLVEFYQTYYHDYYTNYQRDNYGTKFYSKRQAMEAVKKARRLTEDQAEIILSRNLVKVGEDLYRLSWDMRLKRPAPQNYPVDYYFQLFSKNSPPTLLVSAREENVESYMKGLEDATEIIEKLKKNVDNFNVVTVEGSHDVHVTHPERLAGRVTEFLERDFGILPMCHKFEDDVTRVLEFYRGEVLRAKL